MLKKNNSDASLSDIYSEIIQLSQSVGECKSAIEHVESGIYRMHTDIKIHLEKIDTRIKILESHEFHKQKREKFLWNLMSISPVNIVKWLSALILFISIVLSSFRMDIIMRIFKLCRFAFG